MSPRGDFQLTSRVLAAGGQLITEEEPDFRLSASSQRLALKQS